jgi:hypothetical protein
MGLLDKALVLDVPVIRDEREKISFCPDINNIINSITSISSGLEFPSILFTQLKNEFHIRKGALLLPEEEYHFVPWAKTGFDRTTSSRIRIPETIINRIKENETYHIIELLNSEIEIMSDYFSFREFSVTKSLLMAPLFFQNQLVAIVFITEGEILNQSFQEKEKLFSSLSEKAGPLLFGKRESILNKMEEFDQDEKTSQKIIETYIEKHKNSSFILLSIKLNNLIDIILNTKENSIGYRIKQDILRLIKTLISQKGKVIDNGKNSVLLLLSDSRIEEAELFVHQIGLSLNYFYKINNDKFKPEYTIKKFPNDGNTAEELLQLLE